MRTPSPARRRAITSESAWFSLQPSVRTETVGVSSRDITRHHRTANAEQETAGLRGYEYAVRLVAAVRVTADRAGGTALAVDEGAATIGTARGAKQLEPKLRCGFG